MRRRSPLLLSLLLLALGAGLVVGCSGGDDDPEQVAKLLSDTFGEGERVESGKLDLLVDVDAAGLSGLPSPLKIGVAGPFQGTGAGKAPKFDFDLTLGTQDGEVRIGAISTGRTGNWMKLGTRAYTLRTGAFDDFAGPGGEDGAGLSTFGVDPRPWMEKPRIVGDEKLDGEEVTHISAGVDVAGLIEDLGGIFGRAGSAAGGEAEPGDVSTEQREQIAQAVSGAKVDIWTGREDHELRRISVLVNVDTDEQQDGTIRLDLAVTQQGREQPIGPPANPRPLSELTAALAELGARATRGGAASGSGATGAAGATGGSGASGTRTTPLPENASDYDRCLAGAGADIAAAQRCAELIGK